MSALFATTKALRPHLRLLARNLSSLRSHRGRNSTGPRGIRGQRPPPSGIPDNATAASNALLRPTPPPEEHVYNSLSTPVFVPEDPGAVIKERHPAARILENSSLVVQRQIELGNLLLGFEQANKYVLMDPDGNHVGFMAEEENSLTKILMRQWAKTHRSFTTHVFDKHGLEVLRFHRPFSFINSTITAYDLLDPQTHSHAVQPDQYRIIGECQQQWHLLRRKYNLFLYHDQSISSPDEEHQPEVGGRGGVYTQFAYVDEPFLSWDFSLLTDETPSKLIGSVNRNFAGFGREIFTDTGVYALRMDAASVAASVAAQPNHYISQTNHVAAGRGMTLDERAVMLASAVSIDFDYFSRHSSMGHHGLMSMGVFGGGSDHNSSVGAAGGIGPGVGAGMMGGVMGGYGSGGQQQQDEQQPPQGLDNPYQQPQDGGYPYQQQVNSENPFAHQDPWGRDPPQQQPPDMPQGGGGGDGGGGFWFLDDE